MSDCILRQMPTNVLSYAAAPLYHIGDEMNEPFASIFNPPMPPTMESMRIRTMGSYVSAGGGGFIVMLPGWETLEKVNLTWRMRYALWTVTNEIRSFLHTLSVDVTIDHARFAKYLHPEYRIYWPDDETEINLS